MIRRPRRSTLFPYTPLSRSLAEASVVLATRDEVLAGHARSAQKKMRAILARRGIRLIENDPARRVEAGGGPLSHGQRPAAAPGFLVPKAPTPPRLARPGSAP